MIILKNKTKICAIIQSIIYIFGMFFFLKDPMDVTINDLTIPDTYCKATLIKIYVQGVH